MGRVSSSNLLWVRRTAVGVVVFACALLAGVDAAGQQPETDADRIARLRDQAASPAVVGQAAPAGKPEQAAPPRLDMPAEPASAERAVSPNDLIPLGAGEGGLFKDGVTPGDAQVSALGDGWLMSTLTALGVVLLLVFGVRWLLRRGGIVTARAPQGSVVEVLSRTTIAPRSHVLLMRIGTRILVVNDSAQGMRTLATVQDPEEVAELLGAIDASKPTSISKSFSGVMGRLSGGWPAADGELEDEEAEALLGQEQAANGARGALSSVRGRLAALAGGGIKA